MRAIGRVDPRTATAPSQDNEPEVGGGLAWEGDGTITFADDAAAALLGLPGRAVARRHVRLRDLVVSSDVARVDVAVAEARRGRATELAVSVAVPNGEARLRLRISPTTRDAGAVWISAVPDARALDWCALQSSLDRLAGELRSLLADVADACWLEVVMDDVLVPLVAVASPSVEELDVPHRLSLVHEPEESSVPSTSGFRFRAAAPRDASPTHIDRLRALGASCFVRAPVWAGGDLVGAVVAASRQEGHRFGARDLARVESVAHAIGAILRATDDEE
jgi:hypothetical protein